MLTALAIAFVLRTNVPDLQHTEVRPRIVLHQDEWITVKWSDTGEEETHINSRDEDVYICFDKQPSKECK